MKSTKSEDKTLDQVLSDIEKQFGTSAFPFTPENVRKEPRNICLQSPFPGKQFIGQRH